MDQHFAYARRRLSITDHYNEDAWPTDFFARSAL
jgi:hypothetical protein